jgi:hypothetical protein
VVINASARLLIWRVSRHAGLGGHSE